MEVINSVTTIQELISNHQVTPALIELYNDKKQRLNDF